jgi:DNA-binding response OmpR family regulator
MPHINGYQLFQALRESSDPRLVAMPFIFISSRATLDSDIRFAKSLGADDYLVKPVCQEDLIAVVKDKLLATERLQQTFAPAPTLPNGYDTVTLVFDHQTLYQAVAAGGGNSPASRWRG